MLLSCVSTLFSLTKELLSAYKHVRDWFKQLKWLQPAAQLASNGLGYKQFHSFVTRTSSEDVEVNNVGILHD